MILKNIHIRKKKGLFRIVSANIILDNTILMIAMKPEVPHQTSKKFYVSVELKPVTT